MLTANAGGDNVGDSRVVGVTLASVSVGIDGLSKQGSSVVLVENIE